MILASFPQIGCSHPPQWDMFWILMAHTSPLLFISVVCEDRGGVAGVRAAMGETPVELIARADEAGLFNQPNDKI